jgi:VIT1/CCC1 family predicted Fe2+/Mn2+ transporter
LGHREFVGETEELHPHGGGWLREIVLGGNDGLVTTLVFVLAVGGVAQEHIVAIALAELLSGGVAMGLGGYFSSRTESDVLARRVATERHEILNEPEEERAELRAIYQRKGLSGALLDEVVEHLTADRRRWLRAMMFDELRYSGESENAALAAILIGGSFMAGAFVPILPFLLALQEPRWWAFGLTAAATFVLGAVKARYTLKNAFRNGLEFLALVTIGAAAGMLIGAALQTL